MTRRITTSPPSTWGPWRFYRSGLKHQRMDYLVAWSHLDTPEARAWWLQHLAGKNRSLYGKTVARDLEAALHAVLGRSPGSIDADRVAGKYWDLIKPERYRRRTPWHPPRR